ncbi:MAG: Panacea domain-containing protein [Methanocorpusculum sp.]|nr:Panacea domain-containing protein [Methanocorpusculum sp.]
MAEADGIFNRDKFKQVVHYIIDKTTPSRYHNVGKKVLYKLLYFNDFNYYELTELKMTGETYTKLEHGPAPRHFNDVVDELIREGAVQKNKVDYFGRTQTRYLSVKDVSVSHLSAEELQQIDDTLNRYSSMNGSQIEALSHKDIPWIAEEPGCDLDYDMVFYRSAEMSVRP